MSTQPEKKLIGWKDGEPQYIEQPEQKKLCVVCGKPTMHMGNKCYGCCQTAQHEQEPVAWLVSDAQGRYATIRDPAPYGEKV